MDQTVLDFQALRDALQGRLSSLQPQQAPNLALMPFGGSGAIPGGAQLQTMPYSGGGKLTPALQWLIQKESGGRTNADNPKSTAFGVGQLLLANRQKYLGADYNTTDYAKQLDAMRRYIGDRYGTAEKAQAFHQQHGWY